MPRLKEPRPRRQWLLAAALGCALLACTTASDPDEVPGSAALVGASSVALSVPFTSASGTYGSRCVGRRGTWTLAFATPSMPSGPDDLQVVRGNVDCALTVTSLTADREYVATPPLPVSALLAGAPSAFAEAGSSRIAFYGNALLDDATFANPFTVAFEISDDPTLLAAGHVPGSYAGPSSSRSGVAVAPSVQNADGISSVAATVTARSLSGKPLAGLTTTLEYSGAASVSPPSATTDALGQAVFQLYSSTPTTGSLTAHIGTVVVTQSPDVTFVETCALGEVKCGSSCVNLASDSNHCGSCDAACPSDHVCRTGTCQSTCASGSTSCNGQCVTLGDDTTNCGACGNGCSPGSTCAGGVCVAVVTIQSSGCADGTREAFADEGLFPKIAACSGAWQLPGIFPAIVASAASACETSGNSSVLAPADGAGCSASNLCASGWHICNGGEVLPRTGSLGCVAEASYPAASFFSAAVSGTGCGVCALRSKTDTGSTCTATSCAQNCQETGDLSNDVFGCGSLGAPVSDPDCDGLNRFSHNNCSALGAPWVCSGESQESRTITKPSTSAGGVLCCRD